MQCKYLEVRVVEATSTGAIVTLVLLPSLHARCKFQPELSEISCGWLFAEANKNASISSRSQTLISLTIATVQRETHHPD